MRNTFGNLFTLTTYGESHGPAIGGVVDGMPAGIEIDLDFIQSELNRRRPGQSKLTTSRNEADRVELLSGVFEGKSTGTPIGFVVRNSNQQSKDYDNMRRLSDHRMPITPILISMAYAIIVVVGVLRRASLWLVWWVVHWLNWL